MSQFEENNIVFEIKQPTPDDLREPSTYCVGGGEYNIELHNFDEFEGLPSYVYTAKKFGLDHLYDSVFPWWSSHFNKSFLEIASKYNVDLKAVLALESPLEDFFLGLLNMGILDTKKVLKLFGDWLLKFSQLTAWEAVRLTGVLIIKINDVNFLQSNSNVINIKSIRLMMKYQKAEDASAIILTGMDKLGPSWTVLVLPGAENQIKLERLRDNEKVQRLILPYLLELKPNVTSEEMREVLTTCVSSPLLSE